MRENDSFTHAVSKHRSRMMDRHRFALNASFMWSRLAGGDHYLSSLLVKSFKQALRMKNDRTSSGLGIIETIHRVAQVNKVI